VGLSEYTFTSATLLCSATYIMPVIRTLLKGLAADAVVLDLGCGNGSLLGQFRRSGWRLHGLDSSTSGVSQAQKAFPEIHFELWDLASDLASHPLAGQCDVVMSTEVVEHVFLPSRFAENCFTFLKPKGTLIISTPYHGYLKNSALALAGKMDGHFTALWDGGHIKFWSRRTLSRLLEQAGFCVKEFHGAGRVPFLWKSMIIVAVKP